MPVAVRVGAGSHKSVSVLTGKAQLFLSLDDFILCVFFNGSHNMLPGLKGINLTVDNWWKLMAAAVQINDNVRAFVKEENTKQL